MNPPRVYKPDNSLRGPVCGSTLKKQPQNLSAASLALQLHAGLEKRRQPAPRPIGLPRPAAVVLPHVAKAASVFQPATHPMAREVRPPAHTANASPVQARKSGAPLPPRFPAIDPSTKGTAPGLASASGTILRSYPPGMDFSAAAWTRVHSVNFNNRPRAAATYPAAIQPMWSAAKDMISSVAVSAGSWILNHPAPRTISGLLNLVDGIISLIAISLQTYGVAVAGSVTKLAQSVNAALKLAAQYHDEADPHESKKLRAQLIVECVNIIVGIITLVLATQGQLAASVWTNAITTLLAKTTGELYEVYCAWTKHQGEQALLSNI